jgi:AcrR family transcriptional regulator
LPYPSDQLYVNTVHISTIAGDRVAEELEKGTAGRILEAAGELLASGGYEALSMRKIAAMVGLSQAAIYRHFRDKDELVGRLVASGYAELVALVEAVEAAGAAYVGWASGRPTVFKALLLREIGPASEAVNSLSEGIAKRRRTFALLAALLKRGMEEGVFAPADPELTAQAVWTSMFGLAARLVLEGKLPPGRADLLAARHREIVIQGLRPTGGEPKNKEGA